MSRIKRLFQSPKLDGNLLHSSSAWSKFLRHFGRVVRSPFPDQGWSPGPDSKSMEPCPWTTRGFPGAGLRGQRIVSWRYHKKVRKIGNGPRIRAQNQDSRGEMAGYESTPNKVQLLNFSFFSFATGVLILCL